MESWILVGAFVLGACGFQAEPADPADPAPDPGTDPVVDPGPPPAEDGGQVAYVATKDEYPGTADLTIDKPIAIDTTAMSFGMPLPAGITFAVGRQDGGGPELAILHARTLKMHADVHASGSRPFVVVSDSFELTHLLDVAAHGTDGGPGALPAPSAAPPVGLVGGAPGTSAGLLGACTPVEGPAGRVLLYFRTRGDAKAAEPPAVKQPY